MKKRTALYAALICTIMTGCSLKSPVSETVTEPESTAETESAEIPQTPAETTAPPTIEEFPHEADDPTAKPPEQKFEEGCRILLASDIHYLSRGLTDFGDGFKYKVEHGDGKS